MDTGFKHHPVGLLIGFRRVLLTDHLVGGPHAAASRAGSSADGGGTRRTRPHTHKGFRFVRECDSNSVKEFDHGPLRTDGV
jgi:hypothetical protein